MAPKRSRDAPKRSVFQDPALRHPSAERAQEIDEDLPYERLKYQLSKAPNVKEVRNVVHWFRGKDLRVEDNRGLAAAAELVAKNKQKDSRLFTVFVLQPSELDWHGVGPPRRMFLADNLKLVSAELEKLGIPLVPVISASRKDTVHKLVAFAKENNASHVFANFEYEFDEVNRDLAVAPALNDAQIRFELMHDQTVVEPGLVTNASGDPCRVFTPFWHAWTPMIAKDSESYYLKPAPAPSTKQEPVDIGKDIKAEAASFADIDKALDIDRNDEFLKRISKLWPAGHAAAVDRLKKFAETKIAKYGTLRSVPAEDCVSKMSPYFAAGVISVREALAIVRKHANNNKNFGTSSSSGVDSWVREIAFREFYRQMVAVSIPHVVMNMPTSLKLAEIDTEEDEEGWKQWCEGRTGMPFIDAGMRQLNHEGYMHNRLRMNVSSYLRMNLLIDFRLGMRYFANKLVDWDCCNNCFGWDPNYTVFNPVIQGEKLDKDGAYIRKWVPELKDVQGKAIFDPANRLPEKEFAKLNYPRPAMDLKAAKTRSVERLKAASSKRVKKEEVD